MDDRIKSLAYSFEHNEQLSDDDIIMLFKADELEYEKTKKHLVANYEQLLNKYEAITDRKELKMDVEEIKETIEEKIEERIENKKPIKLSINKILLIFIIILLLTIIGMYLRYNNTISKLENREPDETVIVPADDVKITQTDLLRAIAPASEIVSYSYSYANFDVYESAKHISWLGNIKVPFTTDKQVFAYSGKISAGIKDLNTITFEINEDNKTIVVNMPKPEILHNELIKFETYDVKNSIFTEMNLGQSQDYVNALTTHEAELLMNDQDFWNSLEKNTQSIIETLISSVNSIDEYTITYNWAK